MRLVVLRALTHQGRHPFKAKTTGSVLTRGNDFLYSVIMVCDLNANQGAVLFVGKCLCKDQSRRKRDL